MESKDGFSCKNCRNIYFREDPWQDYSCTHCGLVLSTREENEFKGFYPITKPIEELKDNKGRDK